MKNFTKVTIKNIRKRHFQLLEIMVAMVLITLCAAPALKIYTNMYKQQSEILHHYEADHLVHQVHAKIIESMYKQAISFDDILMGGERAFEDTHLSPQLKKTGYQCHYTLRKIYQRKVKGEEYVRYLCELNIDLISQTNPERNKHYHYEHCVQGPPIQGVLLPEEKNDAIDDDDDNNNVLKRAPAQKMDPATDQATGPTGKNNGPGKPRKGGTSS